MVSGQSSCQGNGWRWARSGVSMLQVCHETLNDRNNTDNDIYNDNEMSIVSKIHVLPVTIRRRQFRIEFV